VYMRCNHRAHAKATLTQWGRSYVLPVGQVRGQTRQPNNRVRVSIHLVMHDTVSGIIHRALRIPLSSFIVEDMMEYVHAHATYRFILHDDEEERPRILVRRCSSRTHCQSLTPVADLAI